MPQPRVTARTQYDIGLKEALAKTLERLPALKPVCLPVHQVAGMVTSRACVARVDCPSVTTSLKDGYAVVSADVEAATGDRPAKLEVKGTVTAGDMAEHSVRPGRAVKVMTGARIPGGADAVIAAEFTREFSGLLYCYRDADSGRNILPRGCDVARGETIAGVREVLTPAKTGLLAAGGVDRVWVYPRPLVGVLATGDEIVAPGEVLGPGKVYASNLVTLTSWLRHFQFETESAVVPDHPDVIEKAVSGMLAKADVLLTSGGAWKSERDLTLKILAKLGGETVFHRVRLGPGKAAALVLSRGKSIFCLPGGPPSNEMAFLQIALPGLLHLSGRSPVPFTLQTARLTRSVGGDRDWTQCFQATLEKKADGWTVTPLKLKSRLRSQAAANALITVPEGIARWPAGESVAVQILPVFDNT